MKPFAPTRIACAALAFLFAAAAVPTASLEAAPAGLSEKEAKKFDRSVKRYYKKSEAQKDRNDPSMTWVQSPLVENATRDTFYHLRAAVKDGRTLVVQLVAQKDYFTTQGIYDPNATKWNSAEADGNPLLIESSVATNPSQGTPVQYGFVKVNEGFLRQNKDSGFTVTVKHTEQGDDTEFEIEPELVTAFLQKYDETKD